MGTAALKPLASVPTAAPAPVPIAATAPESTAATKLASKIRGTPTRKFLLGVGVFFLVAGVVGVAIWLLFKYHIFPVKTSTGDTPSIIDAGGSTLSDNDFPYYYCSFGQCVQGATVKTDPSLAANLANGKWFTNAQCKKAGWDATKDPAPCTGFRYTCPSPPAKLTAKGKGASIQGGSAEALALTCRPVTSPELKAGKCGSPPDYNSATCFETAECEGKCLAQYFTCPPPCTSPGNPAGCVPSGADMSCKQVLTPTILNDPKADIMLQDNCPLLCTRCMGEGGVAQCENGGSCVDSTGNCACDVQYAGDSCRDLRYGTCYVDNGACNAWYGSSGPEFSTSNPLCSAQVSSACGDYAFPVFTCETKGFNFTGDNYKSKSCTCVSKDQVQAARSPGAQNTVDSDGHVTVQTAANYGCSGVAGAVCRLVDATQCSTDSDCDNVCVGHDADGTCQILSSPLKQWDGSQYTTVLNAGDGMCVCPNNGPWNSCAAGTST